MRTKINFVSLHRSAHIFSFFYPLYFPSITLALLPTRNSDPRSHSEPSFPLPTTVRAFIFIARIIQQFLSSSTRVELLQYLPTPAGRSQQLILFSSFFRCIFANKLKVSPRWESANNATQELPGKNTHNTKYSMHTELNAVLATHTYPLLAVTRAGVNLLLLCFS